MTAPISYNSFIQIYNDGHEASSVFSVLEREHDFERFKLSLQNLMELHPENLVHVIKSYNTTLDQKDFIVTNKNSFLYKSFFNNNGQYLTFPEERLLFTINKSRLEGEENKIRVLVNGQEISDLDYSKTDALNSIRIFLKSSLISDGDIVTVINDRYYKNVIQKRPFEILTLTSDYITTNFSHTIEKNRVGKDYLNPENVVVFIKKLGATEFTFLERTTDYEVDFNISDPVNPKLIINLDINVFAGEQLIFLNKFKSFEIDRVVNLTDNMSFPLYETVSYNGSNIRIPFPIESVQELDVYINGFKLVPTLDYGVVLEKGKIPKLNLIGRLPSNARLLIKTRNYYKNYHIWRVLNEINNTNSNDGHFSFVDYINENGDMEDDTPIPLDQRFVEVFVNRKRTPIKDLKILGDSIVRVENLKSTNKLEIRSNFSLTESLQELLDRYKINPSRFYEVIKYMGSDNFINNYLISNPNTILNTDDVTDYDVFSETLRSVNPIVITANKNSMVQGYNDVVFTVRAHFISGNSLDITEHCEITPDLYKNYEYFNVGPKLITAKYKITDDLIYESSIYINITAKEIENIFIQFKGTQYIEKDKTPDDLRDMFKVFARYSDFSLKDITNSTNLSLTLPGLTTTGVKTISATYTESGKTLNNIVQIEVKDSIPKTISKITVTPSKAVRYGSETILLYAKALYTDGSTKTYTYNSLSSTANMYVTVSPEFIQTQYNLQTLNVTINDPNEAPSYTESGIEIDLRTKAVLFSTGLSFKDNLIKLIYTPSTLPIEYGQTATEYTKFMVKDSSNNYITLYKANLSDKVLIFENLTHDQDLTIEFFNNVGLKLDEVTVKATEVANL